MAEPVMAETIGYELEVEQVNRNRLKLPKNHSTTSDASIESDAICTPNGIPIEIHGNLDSLQYSRQTLGVEILSSIVDTSTNYLASLKELCHTLISLGESEESERAGLHVHVSFARPNLRMVKSTLKLGAHLEDVFFLLGCMGYKFRGITNDSTYCRPITGKGYPVVNDGSGYLYQCASLNEMLESDSITQFKVRCGDLYNHQDNHYLPVRYTWLNLFNLFNMKGTLEFRVFNKSLNPLYIYAMIELSKYFGQAAIAYAYKEPVFEYQINSVFDYRDRGDIIKTYLLWADDIGVPNHISDIAIEIMDRSPIESIRLPNTYVYSHLQFHRNGNRSPSHWGGLSYRPKERIDPRDVKRPTFVDIHNLRAENPVPRSNSQPASASRRSSIRVEHLTLDNDLPYEVPTLHRNIRPENLSVPIDAPIIDTSTTTDTNVPSNSSGIRFTSFDEYVRNLNITANEITTLTDSLEGLLDDDTIDEPEYYDDENPYNGDDE